MGGATKAVGGGLKSITGGASDLLLGKKQPGVKDHYMALDPAQKKALAKYEGFLDKDTDQMAENSLALQENLARTNAGDLERKATGLVAQRGLGNSSVGLNAIINSTRGLNDKIMEIRSSAPGLKHSLALENLNAASGGIGNILNSRAFVQGQAGGRQGGLAAPLIGAAGTYFGAKAAGAGVKAG